MSNQKKGRVIHTRVPESLDEEIKRKANDLGVSVSNLVRDVLGNTLGLVEDIVSDGTQVARAARGEPLDSPMFARRRDPGGGLRQPLQPAAILGWQVARLNLNAVCDSCNTILAKNTEAAIGVVDNGPRPFRCLACLNQEQDPTSA